MRLGDQTVHRSPGDVRVMVDDRVEHLPVRADAVLEEVRPLPAVARRDLEARLERRPERGHELDEVVVVRRARPSMRVVADVGVQGTSPRRAPCAIASNAVRIASSSVSVARSALRAGPRRAR